VIEVFYTQRDEGPELVEHRQVLRGFGDARAVIDRYPWSSEVAHTEELGEGGGLYFLRTGENGAQASLQLVPLEADKGFLDLSIVARKGFLGMVGRKSVSVTVDEVTISDAKNYVKQLFDFSIYDLYKKHKK